MQQAQLELLVMESQTGNQQAFACLIEWFHPQLVKFATQLCGSHALAQDAVQEAWIKISKKIRSLQDPRAFKSWLYRAVRWQVLDMLKAKPNQYQSLDGVELSEPLDESALEQRQLVRLINQLADGDRDVVYLFYLAELAIAEIALVLDIPDGTVKSRLNRARKQLQQQIQDC